MQELIDAPTRLDLESVRDCSKAGSDGGVFRQDLPVALSSSVNQFAAKHGLTTFMMYLATLNTLLYRYTGRTDFIVGTPTANRGRSEIQDLIGMFVNTIALRADLSNEPTVEEMLKRTRRTVLAAYEHQEYPFEKVVQAVTPERSAGKHPLFDILLVLQNGMTNRLDIPECHISPLDSPKQKPQFDLVFTIAEGVETNTLWIEYDSDRFDSEYIRRFGVHYIHLLEQMVNRLNLQKQLSKLELLSNQEREELKSWNGPCMPLPTASIPSIILEQAKRTAEAVAATYLCTTITYKDLIDRALRRASQLEALGVTRGTAVGLCGERSLELIEGLLAILFAGGAYVPLDPAYPKQRLASIIEDASISTILLTASHLQELLPRFNGTLLPLMKEPSTDRLTTNGTCRTPGMSDPMYVIFTSGSTGRPKGVINSHIGVLNRLHWMARAYPGLATGKVLQKTSFAFDVSVWELFLPLMYGGTIVFAKPGGQADPEYLADLIQAQSINSVHFVPSMLRAFLNVPLIGRKCDSLTRIICSGEELPKDLMLECIRTISAELHNLYGPTEAAVDVTSWHCTEKWEGRRIPIGHPIDNTTIYIISRSGSLVPAGVPGELLIGGANVALGYINQPELTAERFTVDYLSDKAEGRLYHTGDTAGWDFDGNLIFFGRQDQQVKIRGNRIELEEIVTASKALSIVTDAVAVVDGGTSPRILLYVVSSESIYDEQMLRAHLRSYLPTFMLPAKIIRIDSIPLTVNQKLDHARLAQVANMNSPPPEEAPGDRIGKALHEIWCRLLRREDVMGDSSFFDLGGHSLLLLQLKREIAEHLACNVPLGDFFLFPTLASLAAHVQQLSSTES
jgi:amino acid adenylation domain